MILERLTPTLDRVGALGYLFRAYQRLAEFDPRFRKRNRRYGGTPDGLPLPSPHLIMQVAGQPDVEVYLDGGRKAAEAIRGLAALEDQRRILDFGCGCGRVLRQWKDLRGVEVHGTDYNPELAGWCGRQLPFANVGVNSADPPTRYPDGHFDFIYALSVFTHLPEAAQLAWMREFARILSPGGRLLISTHGAYYGASLSRAERGEFEAGKLVTRFESSAGTNLCCVFHPEAYVREVLARGFEVDAFVPEGALGNPRQDAWVFRKPPGAR